jgi:hypothetical protein
MKLRSSFSFSVEDRPGIEVESLPTQVLTRSGEGVFKLSDHSKRVAGLQRIARWPTRLAGPGRTFAKASVGKPPDISNERFDSPPVPLSTL